MKEDVPGTKEKEVVKTSSAGEEKELAKTSAGETLTKSTSDVLLVPSPTSGKHISFDEAEVFDKPDRDLDPDADQLPFAKRATRKKSTIHDYLTTNGYYTCISKTPLPLRWNLDEDSPAGICFEAGNVVRLRSFSYKDPWLYAEVLSGGFVLAGKGDTRREAAGELLEEYFEPYSLPSGEGEASDTGKELQHTLRKLERKATRALVRSRGDSIMSVKDGLPSEAAGSDGAGVGDGDGNDRPASSSSSSSEEEDDGMADRILNLFHRFDVNRDGTIELEELTAVMQALDPRKWTHAQCVGLMNIMDTNKDRKVCYEEFVDWICGTCRWRKERRAFFKQLGVETGELKDMEDAVKNKGRTIRNSICIWE